MAERIVVVGAGPAGLSAIRAYRQGGGTGSVSLVGAELHLPYRRPPLTKELLRGELAREELPLEAPGWFREHAVALHLGTRVQELDAERGLVHLEGGRSLPADVCVLTTGSRPVRPPVPGAESAEVLEMRTLDDSERLGRARRAPSARS